MVPALNQNNYGLGTDVASPQDYVATINQAFSNLGQPGTDNNRDQITQDYVRNLTSSYVNRYHQQTGQVPTEDQVKQFIAQNATTGNAMKFVQGQLTPDQMSGMADAHIQGNPSQAQGLPGQGLVDQLQKYADEQYKTGTQNLTNDVQNAYIPQKQGLVEDLAGQGLLNQANSRYSLNALEGEKNKNLSQGLTQLANQRAGAGINLGLQGAQMGQQAQQFGQSLGLQNRQFNAGQDENAFNQGLANRQLGLAGQLGRMQANQQDNGLGGLLGGAVSGAAAGTGKAGPGWGTLIGAGLGAGLGYAGSRR